MRTPTWGRRLPKAAVALLAVISTTWLFAGVVAIPAVGAATQWPFAPHDGHGTSHGESVTVVAASVGSQAGIRITWTGGYYKGFAFREALHLTSKATPAPQNQVTQINKDQNFQLNKAPSTMVFVPLTSGYEYFGFVTLTIGVDFGSNSQQVYFELPVVQPSVTSTPPPSPTHVVITTKALRVAHLGKAYSPPFTLKASGGNGPYTWRQTRRSLPAGLSLSSNGKIKGTPKVAGNFTLHLQAKDSAGHTATGTPTLKVTGTGAVIP